MLSAVEKHDVHIAHLPLRRAAHAVARPESAIVGHSNHDPVSMNLIGIHPEVQMIEPGPPSGGPYHVSFHMIRLLPLVKTPRSVSALPARGHLWTTLLSYRVVPPGGIRNIRLT